MNKVFIFGHQNPDTDSVCAAISLAYLKNSVGNDYVPAILNNLNEETKYVLDYFNVKAPIYLNDVHLQIKDVNYNKNFMIDSHASIYYAYKKMIDNKTNSIPIVNKKKLVGLISIKDLAHDLIEGNIEQIDTSYDNIIESLNGESILKFNDEIKGNLLAATYKSTTFIESVELTKNDILVVGDRHSVIEYALDCRVKLIILVGDATIQDKHIEEAKKYKINIIKTALMSTHVIKRMNLCNYVSSLIESSDSINVEENTYISDFLIISNKYKHSHYPVINRKNECLGLLKIASINDVNKKKVILVDHNELTQSALGIEESEILEVIDHHKIGDLNTKTPINFRNMAVGSTCTIIYIMYIEHGVEIPKKIKGLLLSGILSDTLMFKSPTVTGLDCYAAKTLAEELKLDYEEYAISMFKASSNYKKVVDKKKVLYEDFKDFNINDKKVGIGQINTLNVDDIKKDQVDYIKLLNSEAEDHGYDVLLLVVTDIINDGSYIFYSDNCIDIVSKGFGIEALQEGYFVAGCLSRKKQVVPCIIDGIGE